MRIVPQARANCSIVTVISIQVTEKMEKQMDTVVIFIIMGKITQEIERKIIIMVKE